MLKIPKIKPGIIFLMMMLYPALFIMTYVCKAPFLLMIVIMVWLFMSLMSMNDLKNNLALLFFLISFFVFLMGREICVAYLNVNETYLYLTGENNFAFACLTIGLAGVGFGYLFSRKPVSETSIKHTSSRTLALRNTSERVFFFCYVFKIAALLIQIQYVRSVGYVASYSAESGGAEIPSIFAYIGAFMPIALGIFLATKPPKKKAMLPLALYEIHIILSLFTGSRSIFISGNFIILIYLTLRNREEKGWISRRMIFLLILSVPFLVVFVIAWEYIRVGSDFSFDGFSNALVQFMDTLGGSVNVIKRVRYFDSYLSDSTLYSFTTTRTVLFENLIARKLFHVTVYEGNSMKHALYGHSLAHTLSLYTYGKAYLAGRGVGSCYIAELYHDFGYIGIFVGSVIYGKLLKAISRMNFSHPFRDGILLASTVSFLLTPRHEFDSVIGNIFNLYSILGYAAIYTLKSFSFQVGSTRPNLDTAVKVSIQ